jgi:hypothetical protein
MQHNMQRAHLPKVSVPEEARRLLREGAYGDFAPARGARGSADRRRSRHERRHQGGALEQALDTFDLNQFIPAP